MNILIKYDEGGLGDTLAILPFAKDFHNQYPNDKLFISYPGNTPFQKQRDLIFFNNPDIQLYSGEKIDTEFNYCLHEMNHDEKNSSIFERIYNNFNKNIKNVVQQTFYIPWYFTDEELNIRIKTEKPICIINSGYHFLVSSKNYGFENYEFIINELKNDILFVQIGETYLNGFTHRLHNNVLDLRNKLNLRQLAVLIYYSDFILCNVSGLNIFSGIPSKKHRTIFTFCGERENLNMYKKCFNVNFLTYYILSSFSKYNCFKNEFCLINKVSECKHICNVGNEQICKCLNDIDKSFVINTIKDSIK